MKQKALSSDFQNEERDHRERQKHKKRRNPATVEALRLDEFKSKGFFLSSDPSKCFNVPFSFSSLNLQTPTLIDLRASACFIDKDFIQLKKYV